MTKRRAWESFKRVPGVKTPHVELMENMDGVPGRMAGVEKQVKTYWRVLAEARYKGQNIPWCQLCSKHMGV